MKALMTKTRRKKKREMERQTKSIEKASRLSVRQATVFELAFCNMDDKSRTSIDKKLLTN